MSSSRGIDHAQPAGGALQSFVPEFILTFLLMFVILSVSTGSKEKGVLSGVAVGSVIALEALFGGPISGPSMNPARGRRWPHGLKGGKASHPFPPRSVTVIRWQ